MCSIQTPWSYWAYDMDAITHEMAIKYHILRYIAGEMTKLHMVGGTFYKPMFFEFPNDEKSFEAAPQLNIMLGSALKVSIQSTNSSSALYETDFYFPSGTWCQIFDKNGSRVNGCFDQKEPGMVTLPSGKGDFGLHLREGFIIPH